MNFTTKSDAMKRERLFVLALVTTACGTLPLTGDGGDDASSPDDVTTQDVTTDAAEDAMAVDATAEAIEDVTTDEIAIDAGLDAPADVVDETVDATDAATVTITTLASNLSNPDQLRVDSTNVYWTDSGPQRVFFCAIGGCNNTPTYLAVANARALAIDATNIYYVYGYSIGRCAIGGCDGGTDLIAGSSQYASSNAIAVDSANAYWGSSSVSTAYRCAIGGCSQIPSKVTGANISSSVIVVGSTLYWTELGQIASCPTTGCSSETTIASASAYVIASDGTNLYWASGTTIMKCAVGGCGQNPTQIASGQSNPYGVATDGVYVYWTNSGSGTVMKCSISNCTTPTQIASGQSSPWEIAVDGTSVYWGNHTGGTIMKATPK